MNSFARAFYVLVILAFGDKIGPNAVESTRCRQLLAGAFLNVYGPIEAGAFDFLFAGVVLFRRQFVSQIGNENRSMLAARHVAFDAAIGGRRFLDVNGISVGGAVILTTVLFSGRAFLLSVLCSPFVAEFRAKEYTEPSHIPGPSVDCPRRPCANCADSGRRFRQHKV